MKNHFERTGNFLPLEPDEGAIIPWLCAKCKHEIVYEEGDICEECKCIWMTSSTDKEGIHGAPEECQTAKCKGWDECCECYHTKSEVQNEI